jgi:hypothetical protein
MIYRSQMSVLPDFDTKALRNCPLRQQSRSAASVEGSAVQEEPESGQTSAHKGGVMTNTETASRSSADSIGNALSGKVPSTADAFSDAEFLSYFRSAAACAVPPAAS